MHHDLGAAPVAVPGDDPGAFPGVGRCDLLAYQRVEQCRFAGLDLACDRDRQRLVEPVQLLAQPLRSLRLITVDLDRSAEHAADGHGQATLTSHPHRSAHRAGVAWGSSVRTFCCKVSKRSSSALISANRRSRSPLVVLTDFSAARNESLSDRFVSSAWVVKWSRRSRCTRRSMSRDSLLAWKITSSMYRRTAVFASFCRRLVIRRRSSVMVLPPSSRPAPIENGLISDNPTSVPSIPNIRTPT